MERFKFGGGYLHFVSIGSGIEYEFFGIIFGIIKVVKIIVSVFEQLLL